MLSGRIEVDECYIGGSEEDLGHVDARTTMGYTHLVTADDVRAAGELGAPLGKEFFAQDLPKFPPNAETASELISEAV